MTLMSRNGLGCGLMPFIGRYLLFATERPNQSLEPTCVGWPPLAAPLQR